MHTVQCAYGTRGYALRLHAGEVYIKANKKPRVYDKYTGYLLAVFNNQGPRWGICFTHAHEYRIPYTALYTVIEERVSFILYISSTLYTRVVSRVERR